MRFKRNEKSFATVEVHLKPRQSTEEVQYSIRLKDVITTVHLTGSCNGTVVLLPVRTHLKKSYVTPTTVTLFHLKTLWLFSIYFLLVCKVKLGEGLPRSTVCVVFEMKPTPFN